MDGRTVGGLLVALLVVLAGCSSGAIGGVSSSTAAETSSPTPTPTRTFQDVETPTPTDAGPTPVAIRGRDVTVRIGANDDWEGSVATDAGSRDVSGSSTRTVDVRDGIDLLSVSVRKRTGGDWRLSVEIRLDGSVVRRGVTTAEYGRVGVSVRFG